MPQPTQWDAIRSWLVIDWPCDIMDLQQAQIQGVAPWTELTTDLGSVKIFADAYPVTPGHRLFVPDVKRFAKSR